MKKTRFIVCVFIGGILLAVMAFLMIKDDSFKPKAGFVPDEETAIRIAEAIWIPIFGKETIDREKPFKATLTHRVWMVTGSLPEGLKGGVAIAEISKQDARILKVIHEK
jgi:NTF2 fold immunity protein